MSTHVTTFDTKDVLNLLAEVVSDAGADHRATGSTGDGCRYIDSVSRKGRLVSVCIVGRLFDYLGILRALLVVDEYGVAQASACAFGEKMWTTARDMGVEFTPEAQRLLRYVQQEQDSGETWGVAVPEGVKKYRDSVVQQAAVDAGVRDGIEDEWKARLGIE